MQSVNLPLFEWESTKFSKDHTSTTQLQEKLPEEKILVPLTQVLEHIDPSVSYESKPKLEDSPSLTQSLDELFPEQRFGDKDIQKAKQILGNKASQVSEQQLKDTVTEIRYLVSTWLDDWERDVFEGKTLMELLHEKGSK